VINKQLVSFFVTNQIHWIVNLLWERMLQNWCEIVSFGIDLPFSWGTIWKINRKIK